RSPFDPPPSNDIRRALASVWRMAMPARERGSAGLNRSRRGRRNPMKAAVLKAFGSPLTIENIPEPELGTGGGIVDVVATRVLAYAGEGLSGARNHVLELPAVPGAGAIGRVRATGPDATKLAVGDWVYCDPIVRSRDDALAPDIALQGLTAAGAGGR